MSGAVVLSKCNGRVSQVYYIERQTDPEIQFKIRRTYMCRESDGGFESPTKWKSLSKVLIASIIDKYRS